ncbi:MAG: hypothetical protein ACLVES_07665 [Faecalibacterium prausnitzii]
MTSHTIEDYEFRFDQPEARSSSIASANGLADAANAITSGRTSRPSS